MALDMVFIHLKVDLCSHRLVKINSNNELMAAPLERPDLSFPPLSQRVEMLQE